MRLGNRKYLALIQEILFEILVIEELLSFLMHTVSPWGTEKNSPSNLRKQFLRALMNSND